MTIRLLDAGTVSHLRSQTIYHGLAYARDHATPDTVVLATPAEPYVCIGFHQNLEREIDLDYCHDRGLPVLRRETGGGAVYLDRNQLFVQWVMGGSSLPARVERRFELFAQPLVETYRELGIEARFRPVNDVHVHGRKIVGTGAAQIGNAEVLVGNFIFDFDTAVMARVLRAPSTAFRDQVERSLVEYMTSMRRECNGDELPDRDGVAALYRAKCAEALGDELQPGGLTVAEVAAIEAADRRLGSENFLHRAGGLRRRGVKIHEDVHVVESVRGSIRVTARLRQGRIEDVVLTGRSSSREDGLAAKLRGVELREQPITHAIESCRELSPDVAITEWVQAILALDHQPQETTS